MIFNKGFICHKKADVINTIGNKIISLNSIIDLIPLQHVTKCHDLKNKYHPANNLIWRQHTGWRKKSQKTHYLIKGQSIDDITVEDIIDDKAIVEHKGKRLTLSL